MDRRLVQLEEKHLFLEKQVDDLDGAVRDMYEQVSALRRELVRLQDVVRGLAERPADSEEGPEEGADAI